MVSFSIICHLDFISEVKLKLSCACILKNPENGSHLRPVWRSSNRNQNLSLLGRFTLSHSFWRCLCPRCTKTDRIMAFFSCDQAALRALLSVCLSVRLSVSPSFLNLFSQCSPNRIIMKFSGIITIDKSDIHAKSQGQRPKVKVKDVKIYLHRFEHFQTVTPVWIHIWLRNDAQRLKWHRGGALLGVSRPWLHFEFAHGLKQCTKLDVA